MRSSPRCCSRSSARAASSTPRRPGRGTRTCSTSHSPSRSWAPPPQRLHRGASVSCTSPARARSRSSPRPPSPGTRSTHQPRWLSVPADLAHTAAASAWLGGLVALLALVPRLSAPGRAAATRRVSATAFAAVPVLAAAGVLRAVTELSAVHQTWTTSYGRALVIKTALFAPAVVLGWLNRTRLVAAAAALRRSMSIELVLLAGVVAVAVVLVQLRPGRDVAAAPTIAPAGAPQPPALPPEDAVVAGAEDGALAVGVARSPSAVTVTLLGPDGTAAERRVLVDGRPTTRCGPGCYRAGPTQGPPHVAIDGRTLAFALPATAPDAAARLAGATRAYRRASSIVFDESLRSGPTGGVQT